MTGEGLPQAKGTKGPQKDDAILRNHCVTSWRAFQPSAQLPGQRDRIRSRLLGFGQLGFQARAAKVTRVRRVAKVEMVIKMMVEMLVLSPLLPLM